MPTPNPRRARLAWLCTAAVLASAGGCSKSDDNTASKQAPTTAPSATPAVEPVDVHGQRACASCHDAIVNEMEHSMHARSHQARDPIFAGVRAIRMKKEGAAIANACERCHTPDDKAKPTLNAGVTCFACHNKHAGTKGDALVGPHDVAANTTAAHATGPAGAAFKDGRSLCLTCHAQLSSPSGVAMCTTGPEHSSVMTADSKTCVDCHMPRVASPGTEGGARADHASHAFPGPHRAWYQDDASFLETAVTLTASLTPGSLSVGVVNNTGHAFPTGFPGRLALVGCSGTDASGQAIWTCKPKRLGKVYVNAKGEKTLAPYATKLASDTRIKAGARADYTFAPPRDVVQVEVVLSMRLLPPPLAKKIGLSGALEEQPKPIAKVIAR